MQARQDQNDKAADDLPKHAGLEAKLAGIIAPSLAAMGYELVRVSVLGRDSPTVQIMADRADGSLIGIEDCESISHAIGAVLDVEDPLPGAWTLEVSSAGIDRPLTRAKDWNRFAGHQARAEVNIPIGGRKRFNGLLLGAEAGNGRLRLDDGTEVALPLDDIRRAKLLLTDALIEATAPPREDDNAPREDDNAPREDDDAPREDDDAPREETGGSHDDDGAGEGNSSQVGGPSKKPTQKTH